MNLKFIIWIILLFWFFNQSVFSDYKKLENINSFDWLLWLDSYSKINSNAKVIDIDVLDADK